jgi:NADH-quinone oxidoreductase subunit N
MTWSDVIPLIRPELILIAAACALFLIGMSTKRPSRVLSAWIALAALLIVFFMQLSAGAGGLGGIQTTIASAIRVGAMAQYIKLLSAGVGIMFVLLSWPTDRNASGNSAIQYGADAASEFFALLLLSIAGIFLVAGANDLILLFLGIELASIPTYIMVSISRPIPVAQEAGVKYFFLGAMAAAVMLFGFSYLYGTTGTVDLTRVTEYFAATAPSGTRATIFSSWQMLGVVMLIAGFAFKLAAVPLHFYAGDVYEGAATPVTALLSYVPKTSGFIALIKILYAVSGGSWMVPPEIAKLMWVIAVLSMTVGNTLGLLQQNVKRVLAYSSIAHSGYMLVGVTALLDSQRVEALQGVLFYLTAYGIMNVAAFGVLMLLPARQNRAGTSAETFEDLAGAGRRNVGLGLAMAVACFSLTGLPLTIGLFGKIYLIRPALDGKDYWLVIFMMINSAISAGYYLRIIGVMFLRPEPQSETGVYPTVPRSAPILLAVAISTVLTLGLGIIWPATDALNTRTYKAASVDVQPATARTAALP